MTGGRVASGGAGAASIHFAGDGLVGNEIY